MYVYSKKQTEGFGAGGGWKGLMVGIKEGTYCMEHWVWCINNESLEHWKNKIKLKKCVCQSQIEGWYIHDSNILKVKECTYLMYFIWLQQQYFKLIFQSSFPKYCKILIF